MIEPTTSSVAAAPRPLRSFTDDAGMAIETFTGSHRFGRLGSDEERAEAASTVIAALAGDGIGPEVMREAIKVLRAAEKKFNFQLAITEAPVGWAGIDAAGKALADIAELPIFRKSQRNQPADWQDHQNERASSHNGRAVPIG